MTWGEIARTIWAHGADTSLLVAVTSICWYAGYPFKHRRVPSLNCIGMAAISMLSMYQSVTSIMLAFAEEKPSDGINTLGALMVFMVALSGFHGSLQMARNETDPPPPSP